MNRILFCGAWGEQHGLCPLISLSFRARVPQVRGVNGFHPLQALSQRSCRGNEAFKLNAYDSMHCVNLVRLTLPPLPPPPHGSVAARQWPSLLPRSGYIAESPRGLHLNSTWIEGTGERCTQPDRVSPQFTPMYAPGAHTSPTSRSLDPRVGTRDVGCVIAWLQYPYSRPSTGSQGRNAAGPTTTLDPTSLKMDPIHVQSRHIWSLTSP